jgi:hypothetical protein
LFTSLDCFKRNLVTNFHRTVKHMKLFDEKEEQFFIFTSVFDKQFKEL